MNLYLIDLKPGSSQRRAWSKMLPVPAIPIQWVARTQRFVRCDDSDIAVKKGIVLIHDRPALLPLEWRPQVFAFASKKDLAIILISGARIASAADDGQPHVYRRRTPVSAGYDRVFAACFEHFWKRYLAQGGIPDFGLLEPSNYESCLALKILCNAWQICSVQKTGNSFYGMLAEWTEPFAPAATAKDIAALMGAAQREAVTLFDAVADQKDLQKPIAAFMSRFELHGSGSLF